MIGNGKLGHPVRGNGLLCALFLVLLGACSAQDEVGEVRPRPVRTVAVEPTKLGETVRISGDIQAQNEMSAAFRIGGKMTERPVNVGDAVEQGQVLAEA